MLQNQEFAKLARQLTLEYFRQNNLYPESKDQIDNMIKDFIEIENTFYNSLNKYKTQLLKLPNPISKR